MFVIIGVLILILLSVLIKSGIIVRERDVQNLKIDCLKSDSIFIEIKKRTMSRGADNFKLMVENDYLNLEAANGFFINCSEPEVKNITRDQAYFLFMAIHHFHDGSYRKKYLPKFQQMWRDSLINGELLALIQDRILIDEEMPQIFGTQFKDSGKLYILENIDSVDNRRFKLGMDSLHLYMKMNNLKF